MTIPQSSKGNSKQHLVWPLSYSWLLSFLGAILIGSLWFFIYHQINYEYDRTIEETSRETANLSKAFEEHVRRIVSDGDKLLLSLKRASEKDGISNAAFASITTNSAEDPSQRLIAVYNEQGTVIQASYPEALGMSRLDREYFTVHRDAASQNLHIGKPIIGRVAGGYDIIPLTRRINKPDGSFGGIPLLPLLQADALRMGHEIHTDINDIPDTDFDESEIRQLILNLVRNSLEAMDQSGIVTIKIHQISDSIFLAVQDTGTGIPDEVIGKLGTPFVTTKAEGTGLGLPICYRIAERHGAKIQVVTGSEGTTFIINFTPHYVKKKAGHKIS